MGITILNALSLIDSWREGACFRSTLTLGRLNCHMTRRDLERIARLLPADSDFVRTVARAETPEYMDDFFRAMGAETVEAMDASDFEGASIVHDLNEPLPAHLRCRFDAVVDGGTIEHVFNVPAAFKAVMEALKVGGTFAAILPANNWNGHGFFQFSAEVFFRVFASDNGFEMRRLLVSPAYVGARWVDGPAFEVSDPYPKGDRIEIVSKRKTVFLVDARKVSERAVFATWPQQGGYARAWEAPALSPPRPSVSIPSRTARARFFFRRLNRVGSVRRAIERLRERRLWVSQCRSNPALTAHRWQDER